MPESVNSDPTERPDAALIKRRIGVDLLDGCCRYTASGKRNTKIVESRCLTLNQALLAPTDFHSPPSRHGPWMLKMLNRSACLQDELIDQAIRR
jgi:hypothetical protein